MVLKTIGFFPLRIEPCRLRFLVLFYLLGINGYDHSEIADDTVAAVVAERLSPVVPVTTGGAAQADTPKFPETRQLSTTPASAPSAAEPERVETDVVPVGTADTTEGQGETAADSDDEMCVTSATLKRPLDDSVEQDGASSTSSQEPPAKAPQGRRRSLKPKPKADTPKFPETRQLSTTPASAPSAAEPERVETDVVPVGTADTTEGQGETAADSDDEMIEPWPLRFLVLFFPLLDIVDYVKSEIGVDAIAAVVAE
ncbi:hypothetical protein MRX96_003097 [Rhipicephalus microplus]